MYSNLVTFLFIHSFILIRIRINMSEVSRYKEVLMVVVIRI